MWKLPHLNIFKNLSIGKKIFLVQLGLIIFIIPIFIFMYSHYKIIEKSFTNIIDNNLIRIQSLLEMKVTAVTIENAVERFVAINPDSPNVQEQINDSKDNILAKIEQLRQWDDSLSLHTSPNDVTARAIGSLSNIESIIVIDTIKIANMKENNKDPMLIHKEINVLQRSISGYQQAIDNLIGVEFGVLDQSKDKLNSLRVKLKLLFIFSISLALIIALLFTWTLSKFIARPIGDLSTTAEKIAKGDYSKHIESGAKDEVGKLEHAFNIMVSNLIAANEKVLSSARVAGMADVANNVLHNVGNVLSSVNVSVDIIKEKLAQGKLNMMKKISDLFHENLSDINAFLQSDKGKLLPGYMADLGSNLEKTKADMEEELNRLSEHVKHIKGIITLEQEITSKAGMVEPFFLTDIIDNSLKISISQNSRNKIQIDKRFDIIPKVLLDKIKLEQILINLIKNAYESLIAAAVEDKRLTIELVKHREAININIIDNGEGIAAENMQKIVSGGFTTKKNGHGFGLHFSALAIDEMGGRLKVTSDGLGKGACFSIELPYDICQE